MTLLKKFFPVLLFTFFSCITHSGYTIRPLDVYNNHIFKEMRSQDPSRVLSRLHPTAGILAHMGNIESGINVGYYNLHFNSIPQSFRVTFSNCIFDPNVFYGVHESLVSGSSQKKQWVRELLSPSMPRSVWTLGSRGNYPGGFMKKMEIPVWENTLPEGAKDITDFPLFSKKSAFLLSYLLTYDEIPDFFASLAKARNYTELHKILADRALELIPAGPLKDYILGIEYHQRFFSLPLWAVISRYDRDIQERFSDEMTVVDTSKPFLEALETAITNLDNTAQKIDNISKLVRFIVDSSPWLKEPEVKEIRFLNDYPMERLLGNLSPGENFFLDVAKWVSDQTNSPNKIQTRLPTDKFFHLDGNSCLYNKFVLLTLAGLAVKQEPSSLPYKVGGLFQEISNRAERSFEQYPELRESYRSAIGRHSLEEILVAWAKRLLRLDTVVRYIFSQDQKSILESEKMREDLTRCFAQLAEKTTLYDVCRNIFDKPEINPELEFYRGTILAWLRDRSSIFYEETSQKKVQKIEAAGGQDSNG